MTEEIARCPFCSWTKSSVKDGDNYAYWVECSDCCAQGPIEDDEDEAIAAWNRRAAQPEPAAPLTSDWESRYMFVARLENEKTNGRPTMSIDEVLALLNDCDYLASLEAAPTVVEPYRAMNAFNDAADLVDAMRQSKNNGKAVALVLKYRNACIAATPPRAALTDEQIRNLWFAAKPTEDGRSASWNFARAVEQAHGIGGPSNE